MPRSIAIFRSFVHLSRKAVENWQERKEAEKREEEQKGRWYNKEEQRYKQEISWMRKLKKKQNKQHKLTRPFTC